MNQFHTDNGYQRGLRDRFLIPFYQSNFGFSRLLDNEPDWQHRGVDTLVWYDGRWRWVEEKIVRWPRVNGGQLRTNGYTAFALETRSCTVPGREKSGWMDYSEAHWLLYCFASRDDSRLACSFMAMQPLKQWFWPRRTRWPVIVTNQINRTECHIVPTCEVSSAITVRQFELHP
jgi:hypothetical protein